MSKKDLIPAPNKYTRIIADTPPKEMDRILDDISTRRLWSENNKPGSEELALVAEAELNERRTHVCKDIAVTALVGAAIAGPLWAGVFGYAKYNEMRENISPTPSGISGQLLPGNALTVDNYITVGDTGVSIPDLRTLSYGEIMHHETVATEQATAKGSTVDDLANNPVAGSNLQLTGQEYAIDKDVARDMLQGIKDKGGRVSEVGIMGLASDEYRGEMGIENPEQKDLALQRAEVAKNALVDTAKEMGVALPDDIELRGEETVQSIEQIEKLTRLAEEYGLSLDEALTRYNGGRYLPEDLTEMLKESIVRGADYTVGYTVDTKTTGYTLEPTGPRGDKINVPLVLGLGAMTGHIVGTAGFFAGSIAGASGRARQRKARARVKATDKSKSSSV